MDEHIFKDSKHIDFKNLSSPLDDGKESLGCLPPDFDKDMALIPGISLKDVDTMDFHFPSLDTQDVWKESPGFMLPDFEIELKKFTSNVEAMKVDSQNSFRNISSPFDYMRESLSGKESLGIIQIQSLDTSFGESSLNPLNDERDIIRRLNNAHIFNTSAGLDISLGTQAGIIAPRKIIKSESACLPSSTTAIYSLSKSPLLTGHKAEPNNLSDIDMDDTVFKGKFEISLCKSAEEALGNLSWIERDSDMVYLDCTPQPDWPSDLENSSKENTRLQQTDVFKKIDKKVPAVSQLQTKQTTDTVSQHGESKDTKLTSVASNMDQNQTSDSTPEELLKMISKMLSKSNISVEQKSKGQMIILQLSEILCSTKSSTSGSAGEGSSKCAVNDSGNASKQHSQSFEKDKYEVYEVLDLSRKSYDTPKHEQFPENPVNLSVVSNGAKKLSRSLSHPAIKNKAVEQNTAAPKTKLIKDNCKAVVKVNVIKPSPPSTACLRKIPMKLIGKPSNVTQKGPLKAVIPVKDMKRGSRLTPEKPVPASSTKKVITPAQDSKVKPLATSTPTVENKNVVKTKPTVLMEASKNSSRQLVADSSNKNNKQGSCSTKKDIKVPSSRLSLDSYELSSSKLKRSTMSRRSLAVMPVTNKVQKPKKLDKENIPK